MGHEICLSMEADFCSDSYIPIPSMYGIYTYIWLISMVNVGKYTIHGWCGIYYVFHKTYITKIHKNTLPKLTAVRP